MSTRCTVTVINHGERNQYYHHCDGYLSGVGWELFRPYFRLVRGCSPERGPYSYCFMERTKKCDLSYDIDESYEYEEDEPVHGDLEYQYLLDFDNGIFRVNDIAEGKIYSTDGFIQEMSTYLHTKLSSIRRNLNDDEFLSWAGKHEL